jgi:hypothetical protein
VNKEVGDVATQNPWEKIHLFMLGHECESDRAPHAAAMRAITKNAKRTLIFAAGHGWQARSR